MKTWRYLFEQLTSDENLRLASRNAARGKRFKPAFASYLFNEPENLGAISKRLRNGTYRFGPYALKRVHEPKARLIAAAPARDRVAHHAIHQVLLPVYQPRFIDQNFAGLENRGSHRGVLLFHRYFQQFPWMIRLDVEHYFPHISWDILLSILDRDIRDSRFLTLITYLLVSGRSLYTNSEIREFLKLGPLTSEDGRRGAPIGNLTSQFFGLLYLNDLDHFAKRVLKIPGYLRYVDDMALFCRHPWEVLEAASRIRQWIWENRHLKLHPQPRLVHCPSQETVFLGYRISRAGIGIRAAAKRRLRRRIQMSCYQPLNEETRRGWEASLNSSLGWMLF